MSSCTYAVYASSREVYGNAPALPVPEDAPLRPLNHYGRSKMTAEREVAAARSSGLITATLRFSNVFGSVHDHADRVVPAFARAAAVGGVMVIEGGGSTYDFTHVVDVSRGIASVVQVLLEGRHALAPACESVIVVLAEQAIATGIAGERIAPRSAPEHIRAAAAVDVVTGTETLELVIRTVTMHLISVLGADRILDADKGILLTSGRVGGISKRLTVGEGESNAGGTAVCIEPNRIAAFTAYDVIIAGAALERVVARAAEELLPM